MLSFTEYKGSFTAYGGCRVEATSSFVEARSLWFMLAH